MSGRMWSHADDEILRRLYQRSDTTARDIAGLLGVTKNSVIARANRLGLGKTQRQAEGLPTPRIGPGGRANGCQWMDGDPRDPRVTTCGRPLKEGSRFSYCAHHHKIVFRKAERNPGQRFELRPRV